MFEQESYDKVTVPTVSQPGELFHNYEIRNWDFSPAIYKILALSAILNVAVLGFIAQTNLLTLRGCDSAFVGRVCQVLDMAYVGAMIYGTDREYVDEAYENIDLGEAEITYIDVTGETPPLSYPEGYFQIANPVQYEMLRQQAANGTASGFTSPGFAPVTTNDGDLLKIPQTLPPQTGGLVEDTQPKLYGTTDTPAGTGRFSSRKGRGGKVGGSADANSETKEPNADQTAESNTNTQPMPTASPTGPVTERAINRVPFKDLAKKLVDRASKDQLNLEIPFLVKASGKLNKDGKLEKRTFRYIKAESPDPQMVKDVQAGIEAFNDSGFLQYLSDLTGKTLDLTLQQDDANLSALVQSEVESETRARSLATAFKIGVDWKIGEKEKAIAQMEAENNPEKAADLQNDKDDLELLRNLKVEASGKNLVINFNVPKNVVLSMIKRKLDEQAAEVKKPNGNASLKPDNNTAAK